MVGLDGQLLDGPSALGALCLDKLATVLCHASNKDGLSPLRTPDEMGDDEVDSVFVASVFHVESLARLDTEYKCPVAKKRTG